MTTWTERRISELIDGLRAGVSVRSILGEVGGPTVLKTSAIKAGRFDPRESKPILPADLPRAKCSVTADSVIISRMNTPALVGDVGYVEKDFDSLFLPDRLWIARSKRGSGTDIRWLTYHFSSQSGARTLRELATGTSGSMKNIPKDKVLDLKVLTPTPPEQRAIADALTDADNLISSLERLIAKKQAIKQGMMQELLSGKTRLPGLTGVWRQEKLGSLSVMSSGGTPPSTSKKYYGGNIPWVSISDMTSKGKYILETETTLTPEGLKNSAAVLYEPDVVLYAMYASLGECSLAVGRVSSSQAILGISTKSELNREFLYHYLQFIKPNVKLMGQQGTQSNLNAGMVRNFEIPLPTIEEQLEIANVLNIADEEIQLLSRRLESARNIKQGMMQELLTGRTRLPVEEMTL
ncbi:DNA restriction-modification system, specificity subunit [Corynebacterium striatum]|nr:hypothetical protein U2A4042230007 [Corynebacterium striatum]VFB07044.1 DNA restriction-modification system, specificity subunit [Corynebacterium striatum]